MSKITPLNNLQNITDLTTVSSTINTNNTYITNAVNNTLSLDGSTPNQMNTNLDMNSNQILNLPVPATVGSPLRLQDLNSFIGGGTISTVPVGGTTGQILSKTSNTDFAMGWSDESTKLTGGNNIVITGTTPATVSTLNNPSFTTSVTTPTLVLNGVTLNGTTGTGSVVASTSPTITSPTLVTPALGTPASGVATNLTGTAAGLTAGNVTTNANLTGPITSVGNATSVASQTGTGSTFVMSTSPTITTPTISTIINTGTLTLPTSTDTLIGVNTANTLTGKTIDTASGANALLILGVNTSTAWANYTPSPSSSTATFTVNAAKFKTLGKTTNIQLDITISGGAPTTSITFNLPNTANSGGGVTGREIVNRLKIVGGVISAAGTTCGVVNADTATSFAVNDRVIVSGVYENT